MAYILNKSNGQQLTVLNDGLTDSLLTSITLIGKNVSNFGDPQNENFLFLLENFANSSYTGGAPRSPTTGQLWFDTSPFVNRPLAFDGSVWRPLAISWYDTAPTNNLINRLSNPRYSFAANQPGDFWVDSVNKQLYVITSTASDVSLIGPEAVPGFGTTKMSSVAMKDSSGNSHPVIQTIVDGEVVSVQSNVTFVQTSTNAVLGFATVYRGVTFKNYNSSTRYPSGSSDVVLHGLHEQLDQSYPRRNVDEHIQNNWYFDNGGGIKFGTTGTSSISWASNTLNIAATTKIALGISAAKVEFDGTSLSPVSTIDLGKVAAPYNNLYVTTIAATTITATDIYESGERVLTKTTLPDAGVVTVQGTTNQITATTVNGVVTLSLTPAITVNTVNATNVSSTNIAGSVVTDNGARVITTATLPYSIATITGVSNQITVNVTGRTANLGFATNAVMNNLTADYIAAPNMYQDGHRVLTTATLPAAGVIAVVGTTNQIAAVNQSGVVTISLPPLVNGSTINATTSTIGRLSVTNGTISALTVNNNTVTTLTAANANISSLTVSSAGITALTVSGDATVYGTTTATNVYASNNMFGYNLRGAYGDYSIQLNATNATINTLTVLNNVAVTGGISAGGTVSGNTVNASQATISGALTAGSIVATGTSNFSNGTQKIRDVIEQVSVITSPPSGTVNINLNGSSVIYYTAATNANWTFNFRGDSLTPTNTYLSAGQSVTVTVLVTQDNVVGYYPLTCKIDGVTVTPKWFGGILPDSGETDCVNAYTFTIVKTGSATYSLFASIMKYV